MKKQFYLLSTLAFVSIAQIANSQTWDWDGNSLSATKYIGTNSSHDFPIRTSNQERMRVTTGGDVGIGGSTYTPSHKLDVDGDINIGRNGTNDDKGYMIGENYVLTHKGNSDNIFVGVLAGYSTVADFNTFVGTGSGFTNTDGIANTFVGYSAGLTNKTITGESGDYNTFTGYKSGFYSTTGDQNCFYGKRSGFGNTTGNWNCFFGAHCGQANDAGVYNAFFGDRAGYDNDGGSNNVGLGADAGNNNVTGSNNTFIGYHAMPSDDDFEYAGAIGAHAFVEQSNSLILGSIDGVNDATESVNVGVGVTAPTAKLHVVNATNAIGVLGLTTVNTGVNRGVMGASNTTSALWNVGVEGGQWTAGNAFNVGVWGHACGNNLFNYGGYFDGGCGSCTGGTLSYGIYARGSGFSFAGTCASVAGYFNGAVISTLGFGTTSDLQFKDSLVNVSSALSTLAKLTPKRFVYKSSSFPSMNFSSGRQYGILAQQIDTVIPELVTNMIHPQERDSTGTLLYDSIHYKAVSYMGLIPWTIRAIQELDSLKVGTLSSVGDSNRVVKWSAKEKLLENTQIYDDGSKIGIPSTSTNVYVNVVNTGSSITAGKFEGGSKGLYGLATGTNATQQGILGESRSATTMNVGVKGDARRSTTGYNIGVQGFADSSSNVNVGLVASTTYTNSTSVNIGVYGDAKNSGYQNIAGQFMATDTIGLNYGIYASAMDTADYAGYFNGDVHITGALTRSSDAKLKSDIQNISADTSLAWLGQLEPKTYEYRRADYPELTLPAGTQYGFVAQDVEKILPQLVKNVTHPETRDLNGNILSHRMEYKSVDYLSFVPLLVGAMQAQESKIEAQQHKIDSLSEVITGRLTEIENRLNGCCGTGAAFKNDERETTVNRINVELNSMQVIVLEQNAPNPFAEQTSISYFVPENVNAAQIVFADMLGNIIKTVEIKSGYGIITVFASNLSTGQYSYTLLVDGKIAETKKMMKGK